MYIFKDCPTAAQSPAWIEQSLRIGDCFNVLLKNKYEVCGEALDILRHYGIELSDDSIFILIQFDAKTPWLADSLLQKGASSFIDQLFAIFSGVFPMHLFTSDGALYGLLSLDAPLQGERVHWHIENCCERLLESTPDMDLHMLISQDESGLQGIFHAANSLRYGADYVRFFSDSPRITFLELPQQTSINYSNPTEAYGKLSAMIAERLGDEDFNAAQLTDSIIDALKCNSACSIEALHIQMQRFCFTLLGHLTKHSIIDQRYLARQHIALDIIKGDSDNSFADNMVHILEGLHRRRMEIKAQFDTEYLNRIYSYVQQHIDSMDLSVSQIAELFHINRSKLTAQFRAYYGMSLAQFIQSQRLARAILLIESHPKRSLEQISTEAGYYSLSTMYRAFQKHGLDTPAVYRNQAKTSQPPVVKQEIGF